MSIMRVVPGVLLSTALVLGACADVPGSLEPTDGAIDGPSPSFASTAGTGAILSVRGFTTNEKFERLKITPVMISSQIRKILWPNDSAKVKDIKFVRMETMNGGEIYISMTVGGIEKSVATVSGDVSDGFETVYVPAGATVKLYAHPDADCRFVFWEENGITKRYDNPITISQISSPTEMEGWFQCGSLGGGGDEPPGGPITPPGRN